MAELIVGPLLRYVGEREATVWVETDAACEVAVLDASARTFHVSGHFYALVHVTGLGPGTATPYEVSLDGERRWPLPDSGFPPSVIRTPRRGDTVRVAFGSCRVSVPNEPPYTLTKDEDPRGREVDAYYALALRMAAGDPADWPHLLFLCGDQVYADEVSPATLDFIRARRDTSVPPGEEVADFEEYTRLYWESWCDPAFRWLLSTVASAMIFDDHDVHDDWNTSRTWVQEARRQPWWSQRIAAAFATYWIYQHVGNLSPRELEGDELYARVRDAQDAGPLLEHFGRRADAHTDGSRWSYSRDLGGAKLVVIDSRAGRVLEPDDRRMVDDEEWKWIEREATGDVDHLLLGTSLPYILPPALHDIEAWDEAVAEGAWGRLPARLAEKLRQGMDLEHWAAFGASFRDLTRLIEAVGAGRRGAPPASIVALSGDVHHAYLTQVAFRRGRGVRSRVYQAVCSPARNPLGAREKRGLRLLRRRPAALLARALARSAGVPPPEIRWRETAGPWFDNQVAELTLEGRAARLRIERAQLGGRLGYRLDTVLDRDLT